MKKIEKNKFIGGNKKLQFIYVMAIFIPILIVITSIIINSKLIKIISLPTIFLFVYYYTKYRRKIGAMPEREKKIWEDHERIKQKFSKK